MHPLVGKTDSFIKNSRDFVEKSKSLKLTETDKLAVAPLLVEERGEWTWLIVADGRFGFLRVPVTIMQWTREEMSFCVQGYFSNAHSIIAVQRAFRLRFAAPPRGRVPGRQSIVNWVMHSEQQGMCHVYEGDLREGLQHRKTSIELEQQYCNLQNALLGSNHLLLAFQDILSTGFFMMN
ncbi:hypothetical protein J6590_041200 [Homalodisca vitripennis]|nr:hypothetical protein J6590_041200 [Homalodisca vitripennis]